MTSSLSSLINNLAEGIYKTKCKYCDCFLKYASVQDNSIKYKCLSCIKDCSNMLNEELKEQFKTTFEFSNKDINKLLLLLRKAVCPYKFMDEWEKFNETLLKDFNSNLNMEDTTDSDYNHGKRFCNDFEMKHLREYHDLYLKGDTLLLADVFENFRKMCSEIYQLDPAKLLSALGLAWQAALKRTKVELELLADVAMLLKVEKGITGGIFHSVNTYVKANNKYMKGHDKDKELSYLKYWDLNNLCGWAILQKLPVDGFECVEDTSQFNEHFIESYIEKSDGGYFLQAEVQYPEKLHFINFIMIYQFFPKRMRIEKVEKPDKTEYVIHIRNLKQALNHGLVLKKVHRIINFNKKAWLKSYIDMNADLRKRAKTDSEKYFFKLMINAVFGKTRKCEKA